MSFQSLLTPFKLKHLTLRNRVMSTAHGPLYSENGMPSLRYQLYQEEKARGGLALTIIGGSSSVAVDSPLTYNQIHLGHDRVIPALTEIADRIHRHGAAIFCQMTHLGRRSRWDTDNWLPLIGPSSNREQLHRAFAKEMEDFDFARTIPAFAEAAARLKASNIDGCELLMTSHHLVDSFLSPLVNTRDDEYGGSLENRMRFPLQVLTAIREQVGPDFIVGIRLLGEELIAGGLDQADCLEIAVRLARSGLIDYLNIFQGHGDTARGLVAMMPDQSFASAAFLHLASRVRAEVDLPVFHASAIRDLETANRAIADGHVDMVAMTRGHIADPHMLRKLLNGRPDDIRQCVGANYCIDRVTVGGDMFCVQSAATGRERTIPHIIRRADIRKNVVVVGGGPAGLEAARVAAERGHRVVLFERAEEFGGQINLAKRVPWRETLTGITRWLEMQVRRRGVEIRLGTEATLSDVLEEGPDIVFVATGGRPMAGLYEANGLVVPAWDILSGRVEAKRDVLLYDTCGTFTGISAAVAMARQGSAIEIVTPEERIGADAGETSRVVFMKHLYEADAILTPNLSMLAVHTGNGGLVVVLRNEFNDAEEERLVEQVVVEHGTQPVDSLYRELRPFSSNRGEVIYDDLIAMRPQPRSSDGFQLFRIGDAVSSRNIHAGIYEAARLMVPL